MCEQTFGLEPAPRYLSFQPASFIPVYSHMSLTITSLHALEALALHTCTHSSTCTRSCHDNFLDTHCMLCPLIYQLTP